MRLKAIIASALGALALSGVLASGAAASPDRTPQELAEHPGMGYIVECDMTEEQSLNMTNALWEQLEAEGKCHARWFVEAPNERAVEEGGTITATASGGHMAKKKHARKHKKHYRASRH